MESIDKKEKLKRKEIAQIIFSIAILLLVVVLFFATVKLSKNLDVLKSNPIDYQIKTSDISYCYCYDLLGNKFDFPSKEKRMINGTG